MFNLNNQQCAIILDVISYFLVTLDLYGIENLKKLHENAIGFTQKVMNSKMVDKFINSTKSKYLLFFLGLIVFGFYILKIWLALEEKRHAEIIPVPIIRPFLVGFALIISYIYIVVNLHYIVSLILLIIERIFVFLISLFLYLLEKVKIKGILLIIGTILFILSKIISF